MVPLGLRLRHWSHWLENPVLWLQRLEAEVAWRQEHISLWGRTNPLPRLTCWLGDPGCSYTYSGVGNTIVAWTPAVQVLRMQLEEQVGWRFNSLLLNLLRNGRDKLDWHADDEPELDRWRRPPSFHARQADRAVRGHRKGPQPTGAPRPDDRPQVLRHRGLGASPPLRGPAPATCFNAYGADYAPGPSAQSELDADSASFSPDESARADSAAECS